MNGVKLSTELNHPSAIPYFLWDEPITVAEFRHRLNHGSKAEQNRLLGKLLREARDTDVWKFTSPLEVNRRWNSIFYMLGRRKLFWEFLFSHWRKAGLIG